MRAVTGADAGAAEARMPVPASGGPNPLRPEMRRGARGPGPGPSRVAYRLARIWKKTWVRRAALILPAALAVFAAGEMVADPSVRAFFEDRRQAVLAALSSRPAFAVRGIRVTGASEALTREIERVAQLPRGASSLTLDVGAIQDRIGVLGGVRSASVKLGPDGILLIAVDERVPAALWRDAEGTLWLADRHGVAIAPAGPRADHPTLPVVMGEGAQAAMPEALSLFRAAPEIRPRLRALIRVGQRRWNLALDRGLTIMLPEKGAEAALARIMALHYGEELLDRDLAAIDMRLGQRPTLRLTPRAVGIIRLRDAVGSGPGKKT